MPIVFCSLELYLPHCHSLKEKRNLLRKVLERTRSRSGFSISEIEHQDLWQRSRLGAVTIGPDARKLEKVARQLVEDIENTLGSDLARHEIEFFEYD